MSTQPKYGAVLFAKNLPRVAKFYEELLSMKIVVNEVEIIVLESAAFQLVVHAIPQEIAQSIEITSPPVRRIDMPTKLFFPVVSIAEIRAKAIALGGELNPQSKEWESRVFRACDGHDPEGNVIQFRENLIGSSI
jgi:predicted enzyme related to lactoylglutathione lyase